MKEQLISFETARLAKEKGFNEVTNRAYKDYNGEIINKVSMFPMEFEKYNSFTNNYWNISAPTQLVLQNWLIDNFKLYIDVNKEDIDKELFECLQLIS